MAFRVEATPPSVVYVDHNYVGLAPDTQVNWPYTGGGTHIIGYDAFATINFGVHNVASLGTVNIANGLYTESNCDVPKAMTITGQSLAVCGNVETLS